MSPGDTPGGSFQRWVASRGRFRKTFAPASSAAFPIKLAGVPARNPTRTSPGTKGRSGFASAGFEWSPARGPAAGSGGLAAAAPRTSPVIRQTVQARRVMGAGSMETSREAARSDVFPILRRQRLRSLTTARASPWSLGARGRKAGAQLPDDVGEGRVLLHVLLQFPAGVH